MKKLQKYLQVHIHTKYRLIEADLGVVTLAETLHTSEAGTALGYWDLRIVGEIPEDILIEFGLRCQRVAMKQLTIPPTLLLSTSSNKIILT